jgi:hypothetical protein
VPPVPLIYETIQFSPYFGTDDPDLPGQIRGAARAGFAGIGIDAEARWPTSRRSAARCADVAELLGAHACAASRFRTSP